MGDLKTEDWERDKLRGADLFERECVDDWTGQTSYYDRNDEVRAVLDDLDTLLAENAKLAEDYRAVLAGACTSAARAGARDATLRRLEAENARLRAVAEAAREYRAMEAPGLDMCRDNARDVLDEALAALEAP